LNKAFIDDLQRFLRSVSGTSTGGLPIPAPTDPTGPDRTGPAQDRPGYFYDVFDTHFVKNRPKRYDILKILIKNVIKQPGPVGVGLGQLVPVQVPVVPVPTDTDRHQPVPSLTGTRPAPTGPG
jgi:hypothetical protein